MLGVPIALFRASMQLAATALLVLNSLMANLIDPRKSGGLPEQSLLPVPSMRQWGHWSYLPVMRRQYQHDVASADH